MTDQPRRHILHVGNRVAGRFTTRAAAEAELDRLDHLARKRGDRLDVTRITVEPQSYQEAQEDAFHERLP